MSKRRQNQREFSLQVLPGLVVFRKEKPRARQGFMSHEACCASLASAHNDLADHPGFCVGLNVAPDVIGAFLIGDKVPEVLVTWLECHAPR